MCSCRFWKWTHFLWRWLWYMRPAFIIPTFRNLLMSGPSIKITILDPLLKITTWNLLFKKSQYLGPPLNIQHETHVFSNCNVCLAFINYKCAGSSLESHRNSAFQEFINGTVQGAFAGASFSTFTFSNFRYLFTLVKELKNFTWEL